MSKSKFFKTVVLNFLYLSNTISAKSYPDKFTRATRDCIGRAGAGGGASLSRSHVKRPMNAPWFGPERTQADSQGLS